ncbi:MAG: methyl-accepting chemotaxis protein [Negativicutes bacterium]|nr:methyl-accepting chemotaxis protein [Negativicutes bacterium]
MRITSIQTRLLLILLPFFILSFAVLSGISYYLSQQSLGKSVNETAMSMGTDYANRVHADMEIMLAQLEAVAVTQPIQAGSDRAQIIATLAEAQKRMGYVDNVNYMTLDGATLRSDGSTGNFADREYFQKVVATKKTYISEPLIAKATGKAAVMLAVPVMVNGQMAGVVASTFPLDKLTDLIKDLKFKDSGYGTVADDSGMVLAHPKMPELIGKFSYTEKKVNPELKLKETELDDHMIALFKQAAETGKQVEGRYHFVDGIDKMAVFTPVNLPGGQRWVMLVTAPEAEVTRETATLSKTMLSISVVFFILAVAFVVIISRRIASPIRSIRDQCLLLAQGDFRERDATIHTEDEIGQLARGFREMRTKVRSLVMKVQSQAEQVAASSEELTASAEQSAQAANQVASSITDVASGASEQLAAADETVSIVEQMSAGIQQIAANTNGVAAQSAEAAGRAKDGGLAVDKAVSQMVQIENTVNTSAKVVARLGERSKEIGQIVDTIAGIAGQTNLLALNAAIEAARAGEQGRGFAVVAEEVRKLAEQSQEAAKKIAELIGEIQVDTDQAVVAMNDGTREVKTGAEVVNGAGAAFREIVGLVSQVSGQVRDISAAIQQMASGSQQIVGSVRKIDALSKKSAGEAQSVSASTEEQLASMEEISGSSDALSRLAQDLQDAVAKFRI